MSMARISLFLTLFTALFLASCADIIPLTGGEEDFYAPKPTNQTPEQGATQFSGNQVSLTFDEYFNLNDVNNTITMNPSVGKLTTERKNRTLTISWEESLLPNTTYILLLNGAIRDLNEGNDSIMQVVFATGTVIDSLKYKGKVVNAYSNQVVNGVSVGLYPPGSDPYSAKPLYATRSTIKGEFQFSYLKEVQLDLFAFLDKNKDQLPQVDEVVGFSNESISFSDTTPVVLKMYSPEPIRSKLKVDFLPPGLLRIYNVPEIDETQLRVNGSEVERIQTFSNDSLLVTFPMSNGASYEFVYGEDTIPKSLQVTERMIPLQIKPVNPTTNWKAGESLFFQVNDITQNVELAAISVRSVKGNPIEFSVISGAKNEWGILPNPKTDQSFSIHFDPAAIQGTISPSDSVTFQYKTLLTADLSSLKINADSLKGQWIVQLIQNEKTVYSAIKKNGASFVLFNQIIPGQYSVRCIRDTNQNGRWDAGNYATKTQPEEVLHYTLTQKLRANWDVEETLKFKP